MGRCRLVGLPVSAVCMGRGSIAGGRRIGLPVCSAGGACRCWVMAKLRRGHPHPASLQASRAPQQKQQLC